MGGLSLERVIAFLKGDGTDGSAASRMALSTFAVRIAGAALAYLSQIVLARLLGAHDYGVYSVAWTFVIVLGAMSCGGFSTSVSRFVPEYRQSGDLSGLRGFLFAGRLTAFGLGAAIALTGIGLVFLFRPVIDPFYVLPLSVVLLALPFFSFGQVQDGIARSFDWISLAMLPTYIWRPLTILFLLVAAVLAGFQANALTAVTAAVSATVLVAAYQHGHLGRRLAPVIPAGPRRIELRSWVIVSMPMLMVEGFLQLLTSADVIMVSLFRDPDEVAVYFAASKTLALVHFVYFAVRAASAHRFSKFAQSKDSDGLASYARMAAHWTFWPSVAVGAGLLLIAPLLLRLFGSGFESGFPLIALLMIGVLARASVGPADALLTMTGHQKVCAGIYAVTFGLNVVFNLLLIPFLGLAGAAIATSCAIIFEATSLSLAARRKLGVSTFVLSSLLTPRDRRIG
ncbi:oligosaccharide flippase family protein [Labrenzia aggregata]|uniref:Oligosaccharide flippase family protein n=2 Tax=Roseibium aggregatum TaxID=187304 RepID=A0A939EKJ4_9HYPH|nr:oligosaccharide flippase family protein [Roseibium aggregatum]